MKKQLLIAAVAATMTSVAMADISISGSANIKMAGKALSTDAAAAQSSSQNMDIDITGSNGATKVFAHLDIDNAATGGGLDTSSTEGGTINVDKLYMTTAIGSVNVKAGDWSSCVGMVEGVQACTTTNNSIALSTTVAGLTVGVSGGMSNDSANNSFSVSGKVAGLDFKIKDNENTYTNISVKGDVAVGTGTGFYAEHMSRDAADSDATLVAAHTVVNGVTLKAASYEADTAGVTAGSNNGDIRPLGTSLVGDYHTAHAGTLVAIKDIKGVGANMDIQGNNVNVVVGNYDTTTLNNLDFADVVVTRKLAAGTTLDMSYGKIDTSATADTTNFGAIINVKF